MIGPSLGRVEYQAIRHGACKGPLSVCMTVSGFNAATWSHGYHLHFIEHYYLGEIIPTTLYAETICDAGRRMEKCRNSSYKSQMHFDYIVCRLRCFQARLRCPPSPACPMLLLTPPRQEAATRSETIRTAPGRPSTRPAHRGQPPRLPPAEHPPGAAPRPAAISGISFPGR